MAAQEFIPPDAYPQMMERQAVARAIQQLRAPATRAAAVQVLTKAAPPMRAAVMRHIAALEEAGGDVMAIFESVHEIRGMAATAELPATGRICETLCRYIDEMDRSNRPLDDGLIGLFVQAAISAAHSGENDGLSGQVADELCALAAKKLGSR